MSGPALELRSVTRRFGGVVALAQLSLRVEKGRCFGLIGPNGAGKTTTFSLLAGYLRPSEGTVRVLGQDPQRPGVLKRRLGVLPQDARLPGHARVGELLTYYARLTGVERPEVAMREVLDRVLLADAVDAYPGALSHGMAKRVALAQALLGDPDILLLDEPTAGLDPKLAAQVRALLREAKGKQTIVVSSHNLTELQELCDDVAILDRGLLVQAGSVAQLTSQVDQFHVQIIRGAVPLPALRGVYGVLEPTLVPSGLLSVRFDPALAPVEEVITGTLKVLLEHEVWVTTVTRGRALEARVLELT